MDIGSICTRHPITIDASAPLLEAAPLMREQHIGALLVVTDTGDGERVAGIVTARDLVVEPMACGIPLESGRVGALVSHPPVSIDESASPADAMHRGIAHESTRRGPLGQMRPMDPHAA